MASQSKRTSKDLKDLTDHGFQVLNEDLTGPADNLKCFAVRIRGPKDTPQENAIQHLRFTLSDSFPFSSPSVGFQEKVFHPNIDMNSGSICLDALNSKWTSVFTLRHVVEDLIPQLLTQPNPDDPLNREAAVLLKERPAQQATRVKDAVQKQSFKETK